MSRSGSITAEKIQFHSGILNHVRTCEIEYDLSEGYYQTKYAAV